MQVIQGQEQEQWKYESLNLQILMGIGRDFGALLSSSKRAYKYQSFAFRVSGEFICCLKEDHPDFVNEFIIDRMVGGPNTEWPYRKLLDANRFFRMRHDLAGVCFQPRRGKRGMIFTRRGEGFFLPMTDLRFLTQVRFRYFDTYQVEREWLHLKGRDLNVSFKINLTGIEDLPLYEKWQHYYEPFGDREDLLRLVK